MIRLELPLCGPVLETLRLVRSLVSDTEGLAALAWGEPGTGKSHAFDLLSAELTGSDFAIERFNGQDVTVDVIRNWRGRGSYGNLFAPWTVKRIDELDCASPAAQTALLSFLDYLPRNYAILATTNEYQAMTRINRGRLPRRFKQFQVLAPTVAVATEYLSKQFRMPATIARKVAMGARPEGELEGVNMGAAVEDAIALMQARSANKALALAA